MIVTFFGHRDFCESDQDGEKLLLLLESLTGGEDVEFYLGGYGKGDEFFYKYCRKYQNRHENAKLIFISPYLFSKSLKEKSEKYDLVIYPALEKIPPKFAITYRNRFMIDQSNVVITYIQYRNGGAYQAYLYAKKRGKKIVDLQMEKENDFR